MDSKLRIGCNNLFDVCDYFVLCDYFDTCLNWLQFLVYLLHALQHQCLTPKQRQTNSLITMLSCQYLGLVCQGNL